MACGATEDLAEATLQSSRCGFKCPPGRAGEAMRGLRQHEVQLHQDPQQVGERVTPQTHPWRIFAHNITYGSFSGTP